MKKMRIIIGLLPILLLIFAPFQGQSILQGEKPRMVINSVSVYIERGPIEILNDSAFALYGFDGSGTKSDPYLIHGINITSSAETLITIRDTTKYFKINSSILNCLGTDNYAIFIKNATYGTIENNTVSNSFHDNGMISIESSGEIIAVENTIHTGTSGIMKFFGENSLISNNTIYNAELGIVIVASDSNTVINNIIYDCSLGMLIGASDYNSFTNNTIHDITGVWNPEPGINLHGGIYIESCYENNFTNNLIFSCAYEGLLLNKSSNILLFDNTIYDCVSDGIFVDSSNNLILEDNIIHDCSEAIILYNCNDSTVNENIIYNTDDDLGIYLESGNNNTFSTNTIYNSAYGIYLESGGNCDDNTLVGNTIYNISEQGIYLRDSNFNTLLGNTIYNCGLEGIRVDSMSNFNDFTENMIYDCNQGIFMDYSHNNTLEDNIIHDIAFYGIAVFEGDNNTLTGNIVYNCEYGIPVASPDLYYNILTGNIVYNCIYGIYIGWSHNTTASGNTVYSCTYGFYIEYAHNNTISYNIVYNSTEYGLVFDGLCENNTVILNNFVDNNVGYPAMEQLQSQALDNGISDEIFSNYWSDWSGTGHYPIDQTMNGFSHLNNDSSPLAGPVLPTLSIITPVVLDYDTDTISVMFSGSPTIMQYSYYIEGVDNQNKTWTTSVDRTLLDGTYTLNAYGSDIAGNTVHESVSFTIDAIVDTTTTTTPETTTSEVTTETTTTSKTSSFPALVSILVFFGLLSIVIRKRKKI